MGLVVLVTCALVAPSVHGNGADQPIAESAGAGGPQARLVDPFIGTEPVSDDTGGGNTFPGPVVPNGMIRLRPDTFPGTANGGGGYSYADSTMRGFSLTRLSGTGCPVYGDVPLTPTTAPITGSPVDAGSRDVRREFMSTFSHDTETAAPGFYSVDLEQSSGDVIAAQLSSATRAAVARFTFPRGRGSSLLVNAAGSRTAKPNSNPSVAIDPTRREITGSTVAGGLCAPDSSRYTLHFAIRFDRPFASFGTGIVPGDGTNGFAEGTAAQYTWMVPHDPAGLFDSMGGATAAVDRLDAALAELNGGWVSEHANLGNEPSAGTPWLYNWAGRPDRAQQVVRRALTELYPTDERGFPGNDDLGQMSAWYVLSAVGLYPAVPGTDILALAAPLFPRVTLHLPGGAVEIHASDAGDSPFVAELRIDGRSHDQSWVHFADLASGGRFDYGMAEDPATGWATGPDAAPPSFAPDASDGCVG